MEPMKELTTLAKELFQKKLDKAAVEKDLAVINIRIQQLAEGLLPDIMQDQELTKFTIDNLGTISLKPDLRTYVHAEDREESIKWLKDNGYGDIVKETAHHVTVRAWAKEMISNGKEVPEIFTPKRFFTIGTRRMSHGGEDSSN